MYIVYNTKYTYILKMVCTIGKYTLENEHKFLMILIDKLGSDYQIIKSQNKYCNVDFVIINKLNLKTVLIEHKFRNVDDIYDTLFIGKKKIENIDRIYDNNCILVWEFANNEDMYFIKTNEHFIKTYPEKNIQNGTCLEIIKTDCEYGLSDFILFIKNYLTC